MKNKTKPFQWFGWFRKPVNLPVMSAFDAYNDAVAKGAKNIVIDDSLPDDPEIEASYLRMFDAVYGEKGFEALVAESKANQDKAKREREGRELASAAQTILNILEGRK